ncbi:hypothetical protein [Cohnella thermotolerans]|uniref:hypothetical protein n=1 Tax=Cohnella thermotolerans TaxID=329858 RepID=UPI0004273BEA|nr:hypothetical protein [Cohnella thermotolerans]
MVEKLEELLGRKLSSKERRYAEWIEGWDRETISVFISLFNELHAAGLVRGLTGRAGGKMVGERGWVPLNETIASGV